MDNQKETELTLQGMADCMDMVRQELVEAGVVKADVPPMFLAEAVLSHVAALGADLRSTLAELTAVQRKLIDANAEIAALLLARETPSDGEIYEAVSRRADPAGHAAADAEARAMLGNWRPERKLRAVMSEDSPLVKAHRALLAESVTVTEKGPWSVSDWGQGRIVIQSNDFTHDVALEISGDFGSVERELAHAEEIARRLNAYPVRPYTHAVGAAAEGYYAQFASAHPLPAQWSWSALWNAMEQAAITGRALYTCIGKGGTYENLGPAVGAGEKRGNIVIVYRDVQTGQLYYRDPVDFGERMQAIGGDQ